MLDKDCGWDKRESHTCPRFQLVLCSDVNAADRLSGQISPQIWALLNLTLYLHQPHKQGTKKPLFIHFKMSHCVWWAKAKIGWDLFDLVTGKSWGLLSPAYSHITTARAWLTLELVSWTSGYFHRPWYIWCWSVSQTWVWAKGVSGTSKQLYRVTLASSAGVHF